MYCEIAAAKQKIFPQKAFHPISTGVWVKIKEYSHQLFFDIQGQKLRGCGANLRYLCYIYLIEGAIKEFWVFEAFFF